MKLSIIPAGLDFLRYGGVVSDPAIWKKGGEALKGAIVAAALSLNPVLKGLGYDFQIPNEVAYGVAAIAVWLAGLFFTAATSDKFGILPRKPSAPVAGEARDTPSSEQRPLAPSVGSESAQPIPAMEVRLKPPSNQEDAG